MNTIDRLRPEIRPLEEDWSASTLAAILSSREPAPSPRRTPVRRLTMAGAAAAGVIGLGGLAYATGLVPALVSDELDAVSPSEVTDVRQVGSFSTRSNGETRTFEVWRGTNEAGQSCTAVREAEAEYGPQFGGSCGDHPTDAWFDLTSESYAVGDAPPPATLFVYGEPNLPQVASVRVVGDGFEHHVTIDQTTGGYAIAIPELRSPRGQFATVEFLDADGNILRTSELEEH